MGFSDHQRRKRSRAVHTVLGRGVRGSIERECEGVNERERELQLGGIRSSLAAPSLRPLLLLLLLLPFIVSLSASPHSFLYQKFLKIFKWSTSNKFTLQLTFYSNIYVKLKHICNFLKP